MGRPMPRARRTAPSASGKLTLEPHRQTVPPGENDNCGREKRSQGVGRGGFGGERGGGGGGGRGADGSATLTQKLWLIG